MASRRSPSKGPPVLARGSAVAPGYDVREHLSRGRALDVYEVWSVERRCLCVVKTLRPDRKGDRSARRRLMLEGNLLLDLTHPHVVRAYEVIAGPRPVVVLETLAGATLAYLIKARKRRLPTSELAVLGTQLASAVDYLHGHGYLHLDLKPSNVVCELGLAKLIDLSVVRPPGNGRKPVGTRPYMAPEQARCAELTPATDVWGLGAVLYEAATGFRARGEPVRRHRRLPAEVAVLVDACLETEPSGRPTLRDVGSVLERFI